jgi:hypothetical protein
MKPISKTWQLILVSILLSTLLVAAAPAPLSKNSTGNLIRLTVINYSDKPVYLYLRGAAFYYLPVNAGETKYYTPEAGVYDYELISCGVTVRGVLDLTKQLKLVVPECGQKGGKDTGSPNTIDAGALIRLVRVTLKNEATGKILVILDGTNDYVFLLAAGEEKEITIPKGYYQFTQYGCGPVKFGNLYAFFDKVKEFTCP